MGRRLSRIDHVCRGDSVVFPSAARSIPGASTPESKNTCASSSYAHLTAAESPGWVVRRRCLIAPEWHSKTKALGRMRQNAFGYVSHVIIRRSMWCMLSSAGLTNIRPAAPTPLPYASFHWNQIGKKKTRNLSTKAPLITIGDI